MIACLDVDYRDDCAVAACVLFDDWQAEKPSREIAVRVAEVADYSPGEFYRRELPCLMAVLNKIDLSLTYLIVDGYVWLSDTHHPGLGARLYDACGQSVPVIGVAKTRYQKATLAKEILHGESLKPLFISAVGLSDHEAAARIAEMHGSYRIPTLLQRVDQLCRSSTGTNP